MTTSPMTLPDSFSFNTLSMAPSSCGRTVWHTIVVAGTKQCVNRIAADYLIDLRLPPEGASCDL